MFYNTFIKLCNQKGVKPADVSRATGIKENTISNWKGRQSLPRSVTLQKVADYFGVTVDYFKKEELPDNAEQSENELDREIIEGYSRLSEENKKVVSDLIQVLLSHHE